MRWHGDVRVVVPHDGRPTGAEGLEKDDRRRWRGTRAGLAADVTTRRYPPLRHTTTARGIAPGHVRGMTVQEGRSKDCVV